MKKIFFVSVALTATLAFVYAQNATVQQNGAPPLLMQQYPAPAIPPPAPGMQPGPAGTSPAPVPGIPVVQTLPMKTLLANLPQAIATVQKLNKLMAAGKVWIMRAPAGESEIKGGLLYQGVVVAVLRFNPLDGNVLPLGINPHAYRSNVQIQSIKSALSSAIGNLKILPAAEFTEPEACWSFPVVLNNTIVSHIKVYYDGIHVVQDFAANQEMTFYGQ